MRAVPRTLAVALLAAAAVQLVVVQPAAAASAPTTVRVSVSSTGGQANGRSAIDAISPNGRFVLFDSWASNLVSGDTNDVRDVFLRDRKLGRTIRVSVGPTDRQANGPSRGVAVSSDGRFVLFVSDATNITSQADRNHNRDVFVRNRLRSKTFRVGVRQGGGQFIDNRWGGLDAVGISDNGRWVAFAHYTPYQTQTGCCKGWGVFIRDRGTRTTRRIGAGTEWVRSELPLALSPDGRWLVLDRSFNIGFALQSLATGHIRWVGRTLSQFGGLTPDAHYVGYATNNGYATTSLVRWDRSTGQRLKLLSSDTYSWLSVQIGDDGGYLTFTTEDPTLVPGDTNGPYRSDLFGIDVATRAITRLDLTSTGDQINRGLAKSVQGVGGYTRNAALSGDGRWAAFSSAGGRVVRGDTNHATDVFLRGPLR